MEEATRRLDVVKVDNRLQSLLN